ncbi:4-alpha-glucanotransferase [Herbaspirillum sp. RTI4]|uniref:4-alpha-glucanotransferase n=1 Tax=Herbaspirillum sp. RTI4 TaxID=3048640 RepID=UPI002AB3DCC4|nr:4-alpha-glucanotransferase [Herbaspirillum sp. RTI4]MDY7579062.1 4-alpha-glucanotransferase [Herbaspirillum sp. RTI4]MEA9982354.1 4-alpha-glucanotransferase [Herbaspirillum sp. RTI4]
MSRNPQPYLQRLAQAAGLYSDWIDAFDQPQQVADESLRTILSLMGLACGSEAQCQDSLRRLAAEEAASPLPPLMTATVGEMVSFGAKPQLAGLHYRLELASGQLLHGCFADDTGQVANLPAINECGYHRLQTDLFELTLAVAPRRCFGVADAIRAGAQGDFHWGVSAQIYGVRSHGDGGIGHFGGLDKLVKQAAGYGATALAISPVHAMFAADPSRYSPYGPSSRLFLNALHVDPAAAMGAPALAQVLSEAGEEACALHAALEQEPLLDWARATPHKLALLRRLYEKFCRQAPAQALDAFDEFSRRGGAALRSHALYEALSLHLRAEDLDLPCDWRVWPQVYRQPDSPETLAFGLAHADEIRFHQFLQWQAACGLSQAQQDALAVGMGVGIITDLAIGADNGGSQAWAHQEEILQGLSVGAPPDLLNTRGQNWGLGVQSARAMQQTGFRAYLDMLRVCFAHAGGVRIDHVLGLARMWLVPEGGDATAGAYQRYPARDLLRLIALESWRHKAIVIGEDLGTVPAGFGDQLAEDGLYGMRVLWFQHQLQHQLQHNFQHQFQTKPQQVFLPPQQWSTQAIAVTTTHDLPTVAGWWSGVDLAWRATLDLLEPGVSLEQASQVRDAERASLWRAFVQAGCAAGDAPLSSADSAAVVDAALVFVARSASPLAMLPLEDLLGLTEQPNLPGTVGVHPNWRRRLPEVESLLQGSVCAARLKAVQRVRQSLSGHSGVSSAQNAGSDYRKESPA